ncbi:MAG: hypothetical protein OEW48_20790, partial [Phycisphaerae bacterium]|nr:hypothetical protein [Phycisphaerae bacterium]
MKYHENLHAVRLVTMKLFLIMLLFLLPGYALAENEIAPLRKQLDEQRALINEQREMLKKQQQKIDKQTDELERMSKSLEEMEKAIGSAAQPLVGQPQIPATGTEEIVASSKGPAVRDNIRDNIGDLNERAVKAGDFPGSFKIPGTKNVSLAIGGFIKTVGIYDSKAEAMGANVLPATLGTKRSDEKGATSLDATLTRLFLDARAPAGSGQLRGYVEYDMNNTNDGSPGFKLRHAYGTW